MSENHPPAPNHQPFEGGANHPTGYGTDGTLGGTPPQPTAYPATPGYGQSPYGVSGPTNVYVNAAPVGSNGMPYSNGLGTAAMVLGIVGVTVFWLPWVNFVCPTLALIFGWVGLNRVKKGTASNKGSAVTGLVLGGIVWALSLIVVIIAISFVASLGSSNLTY